jgi:hypothetical protein
VQPRTVGPSLQSAARSLLCLASQPAGSEHAQSEHSEWEDTSQGARGDQKYYLSVFGKLSLLFYVLLSLWFAYINYTRFHCDISIYAYNVLWSSSFPLIIPCPPSPL